jgi:hypothetical protein
VTPGQFALIKKQSQKPTQLTSYATNSIGLTQKTTTKNNFFDSSEPHKNTIHDVRCTMYEVAYVFDEKRLQIRQKGNSNTHLLIKNSEIHQTTSKRHTWTIQRACPTSSSLFHSRIVLAWPTTTCVVVVRVMAAVSTGIN